jgi:hypothetical protein
VEHSFGNRPEPGGSEGSADPEKHRKDHIMPAKNNPEEWCVYTFCRAKKTSYISKTLGFEDFKSGVTVLLSFHEKKLKGEELRIEIDNFAARFSDYMWALLYKESDKARTEVRDAVRTSGLKIQDLFDVVKSNYK